MGFAINNDDPFQEQYGNMDYGPCDAEQMVTVVLEIIFRGSHHRLENLDNIHPACVLLNKKLF